MPARRSSAATAAAAAAVIALTLAGCSGDEPEPTPTPSEDAGTPLETMLADYLKGWSGEDVSRRLAEMEDLIAACMAEQGFSYTPVDYSAMEVDLSAGLEMAGGRLEFAEQYGYGITTNPFTTGEDEVTDPNEEYVAAMSDAERDAYLTALYGAAWSGDPADDGDDGTDGAGEDGAGADDAEPLEGYDWTEAGCSGRAQQEVMTPGLEDDEFAALEEELITMLGEAEGDPRLAQANSDWSACMLDAGYDGLAQVGDGEASIMAEVEAAQAEVLGQGLGGGAPTDPEAAAREAMRRGLTNPSAEAALEEAVAAITPREIATAVADAKCRESSGYEDVRRAVDTEYQLEFLAQHGDEIQDWLQALSAGG